MIQERVSVSATVTADGFAGDAAARASEAGARAEDIYNRDIQGKIAEADRRKYLYIDIHSGDYEIDAAEDAAEERLRARRPTGFFVIMRADGGPAAHFGATAG